MWNVTWILMLFLGAASGQTPGTCLHGDNESVPQRERRLAAIEYLKQTHAAQMRVRQERGTYAPLSSLGLSAAPVGFVPRLTFDQWNYQISVKDLFDSCGFALFSDHEGVIYAAHPTPNS